MDAAALVLENVLFSIDISLNSVTEIQIKRTIKESPET